MMIDYAILSCSTVICRSFTSIRHSCLHFGQNRGKFFNSVSNLIFSRVLFPQAGQRINSVFDISVFPPLFRYRPVYDFEICTGGQCIDDGIYDSEQPEAEECHSDRKLPIVHDRNAQKEVYYRNEERRMNTS